MCLIPATVLLIQELPTEQSLPLFVSSSSKDEFKILMCAKKNFKEPLLPTMSDFPPFSKKKKTHNLPPFLTPSPSLIILTQSPKGTYTLMQHEQLEIKNVWHFCLKNDSNILLIIYIVADSFFGQITASLQLQVKEATPPTVHVIVSFIVAGRTIQPVKTVV